MIGAACMLCGSAPALASETTTSQTAVVQTITPQTTAATASTETPQTGTVTQTTTASTAQSETTVQSETTQSETAKTAPAVNAKYKGWVTIDGLTYYYKKGAPLKGYHKINGKYYYFDETTGARLNGIYLVEGKYRFFRNAKKNRGAQITKKGWKKISGKKYYLKKNGIIKEGFIKVKKKTYYQTVLNGIHYGIQEIGGQLYFFNKKGVYNAKKTKKIRALAQMGDPSDVLFFTKFESGEASYAQVGGDNGNACGKYQFDRRYSLVPFLQYCYSQNPDYFAGFAPFIGLDITTAKAQQILKGNQDLYTAWTNCYNANPTYFSQLQDAYALEAYYAPVERTLMNKGINLTIRPYVVRGAVFSYAIQEGTGVAAAAVIAAGITNETSNYDFLNALYDYRWSDPKGWNQNSLFQSRYTQEKALAIEVLARAQPGTF